MFALERAFLSIYIGHFPRPQIGDEMFASFLCGRWKADKVWNR